MFALANLINALAQILDIALSAYLWIIIARAIISWVNPDPYNPIVRFLYQVTEPLLYRVRRVIPFLGGLDLSPMIVILAIYFIKKFAVVSLIELAIRMKAGGGTM
ncbi:MAG: YggT family protein [Deltaproteobacteria bacterium]|nr:YggT family protein [Deltaproteobacteria bacterium]